MTEINRYHIFVSSQLRSAESKSSSDFSIEVNPPLVLSHPNHYFVSQIMSVELPYSWFQINSTNNTLPFIYNMGAGNVNYTATIAEGNYNVIQLLAALYNAVAAVIPTPTWTDGSVYNPATGRITFGIKNPALLPTIIISYDFPANPFLARMFGCLNNSFIVYGYTGGSYYYATGQTNVNVNPVSSVYIRSTNLKQIKNQENLVVGHGQDPSDILCKLQVYTPPKTIVFYNGELGLSARIANPIIDKLDIYLSDNYSFGLDLKGNDWTFRISFYEMKPLIETEAHSATLRINGTSHLLVNSIQNGIPRLEEEKKEEPVKEERRFQK